MIMKMRACVCTQPVRTAVGEEETTESTSNVIFPSLSLFFSRAPSVPPPDSHSHAPPSLPRPSGSLLSLLRAIILLGYAMHSTPTETSWCWRLMYQWWCLQIHNAVAAGCCSSFLSSASLQTSVPWDFTAFALVLEYHQLDSTNSGTCLFLPTSAEAACHLDTTSWSYSPNHAQWWHDRHLDFCDRQRCFSRALITLLPRSVRSQKEEVCGFIEKLWREVEEFWGGVWP